MADIVPFCALRYNPAKVAPSVVMTQPYDKITPQMQDAYYAASPYNLVRIILGKARPDDSDANNVYTRAAALLKQWESEGVLTRDHEPGIYVYSQLFKVPGDATGREIERRGFIALGRIEDYDRQVVFRHEQTLSKPKADRLYLLRATAAHCGQIFMLYNDPEDEVARILDPAGQPTVELRDEYDVLHRMWRVSNPAVLAAARAKMTDKKLIIADGHHRYETALTFRNEMRQAQNNNDAEAPYERVMMTFVNMDAPGLVILPTHRVVFGLEDFSIFDFVVAAHQYFDVRDIGPMTDIGAAVREVRKAAEQRTALLAITAHSTYLLLARTDVQPEPLKGLSPQQRSLDVVQLHKLILEDILGMSEEDIRAQKHLRYIRDAAEAAGEVTNGRAQVSFLMNPVRIEQMRDVAFGGEVMPQKSTDFYPKMLSGLAIYSLARLSNPGL